jgi:hypothetical protein
MTVLHVLKRLLIVVVAYALAVVVGLIAVVVIYAALSSLPGAPAYFSTMSMSPLIVILLPPVGLLVVYVALILTCLPSLALALISELFSLRQAWLFGLVGALIAAGTFLYTSPLIIGSLDGSDFADLAIIAASGLSGGGVYWLLAGRQAGFIRPIAGDARLLENGPAPMPSTE